MIQLALFACEAETLLGATRRARGYLSPSRSLKIAPSPPVAPPDPLGMAMADAPTGVLDFPTPAAGDPAWERFGLIVVDAPRTVARSLRARSRWAG